MKDMERKAGKVIGGKSTLDTLDTALANFVAQNRRLPCPANGVLPSTSATAGAETLAVGTGLCAPANQRTGVVPWRTLGLPESAALDVYGNRISYRVDPRLALQFLPPNPSGFAAMNMVNCTPGGLFPASSVTITGTSPGPYNECGPNAGASSQDIVLANRGLPVTDGAGIWLNNPAFLASTATAGAAYVLISHGQNAAGAYMSSGTLSTGTGTVGTNETPNRNNRNLMTGSVVAQSYRDVTPANATQTAQHFDDVISHPTIIQVLAKAHLNPRN